jgi:hypothetical protein
LLNRRTDVRATARRESITLAAIRLYAQCMAQMGGSPAAFAHHLAYLQIDLTDPDFFRNLRKQRVLCARSCIRL